MEKFRIDAEPRQGIAKAFAAAVAEKGGDHDMALLVALYFSDEKFRATLHDFSWKLCERYDNA